MIRLRNSFRKLFILSVLSAFLIFFSPLLYPSPAFSEVTIDFWEFVVGEELMRSLLDKFERQNPGIKVRFQQLSWDYGLNKLITAIAAGNAPDLVELGTDWVPQFSSSGILRDITEKVEPIRDQYLLWDPVTYKGRVYGIPWLAGTRILFYNRALFAKAGLNPDRPPATWEELLHAVKAVDALGPEIYGFGIHVAEPYAPWQQFLPFAWGNGADVLDKEWTRPLLDEPPMVEALNFYASLKPYSLVDRQSQVNQLFAEGKVGVQISGSWNFALIPRMNPTLNFGIGLLPKPAANKGTPASFAGGEMLVILKQSRHPEEALKLALFLIQEEQAMAIVEAQRNIVPTTKSAIQHPYYQTHPEQRVMFEQARFAVAPPAHPNWVKMEEKITRMIEEVILNNRPPEKVLKETAAQITPLLSPEEIRGTVSDIVVFGGVLLCFAGAGVVSCVLRRRKGPAKRVKHSFYSLSTSAIFLAPWLITFLCFSLVPLLHSLVLSFCRYNLLSSDITFVGLRNFWDVIRDKEFRDALGHTIFFAVGTIPFTMMLALFAAVLINTKIPFKRLYQAGLFLPVATSVIVISMIFTYLYAPDGLINKALEMLHLPVPSPSWLLNTQLALPAIMIMNIWSSFGYYMVLFLAGLQTIPVELYEAASIDGANEWEKFRHITLPQLRPIILLATVINTIHTFQVFPEIFAMTQGGPLGATTTVVWYLYQAGFSRFEMGKAAAVGYMLFLITMCFSWVQMRMFKYEEPT
ncbi:MAG: extracellular solute-binding protein [Candidatus Omnitrophica bacterium]|nr:extracellular solute-binding protein [Candidatus Omnitrophota bacterium]